MYQAGLLTTNNPDSPLNTLEAQELKETFEGTNKTLSLSETALEILQSFIKTYSGTGQTRVKQLKPLLDTDPDTDIKNNSGSKYCSEKSHSNRGPDGPSVVQAAFR